MNATGGLTQPWLQYTDASPATNASVAVFNCLVASAAAAMPSCDDSNTTLLALVVSPEVYGDDSTRVYVSAACRVHDHVRCFLTSVLLPLPLAPPLVC